nr:MAG TPA: hypothetical protein [Caudoviricetes sp.]
MCSLASPWFSVLIRLDSLYSTWHFGFYTLRCRKQPSVRTPPPQGMNTSLPAMHIVLQI